MKLFAILLLVFGIIAAIAVIVCISMQTHNKIKKIILKQMLIPERLRYAKFSYTGGGITKLFIRTGSFAFKDLPSGALTPIHLCLKQNSDYKFVYFSDKDCNHFIQEEFPEYWNVYIALKPSAFKADIFRLLVLYKYGGVYNDLGHTYLSSMRDILTDTDKFVTVIQAKNLIHNALICCTPRHPLIKHILDYTSNNVRNRMYGSNSCDITGPTAIGKAVNVYFGRPLDNIIHPEDDLLITNNIHLLVWHHYGKNFPYDIFLEDKGKKRIQTKFQDYYNIMYTPNKPPHYDTMWNARDVYA